jgi:hypothetical protein
MDHQAELATLTDPRWAACRQLLSLVHADREVRIVQAALARDLARVYASQASINNHAAALCDQAITMFEDLRRLLAVDHERGE